MSTQTLKTPGLLSLDKLGTGSTSQGPVQKQQKKPKTSKVTTTVRLDSTLKRRAEEYARAHHMDFTTFLSFSIQNTMQYGGKMEPYYEISDEYSKYLDEIEARYDRGEEKAYGPFSTKEENRAFLESIR